VQAPDLLDRLPTLNTSLSSAPPDLQQRRLYDAAVTMCGGVNGAAKSTIAW
jgi:hypothetical protein